MFCPFHFTVCYFSHFPTRFYDLCLILFPSDLKNKDTGIDISIPSHKEIPGLLTTTVEYHVVTVTILQCFKQPKHKETDVVQFMVGSAIEKGLLTNFVNKICLLITCKLICNQMDVSLNWLQVLISNAK